MLNTWSYTPWTLVEFFVHKQINKKPSFLERKNHKQLNEEKWKSGKLSITNRVCTVEAQEETRHNTHARTTSRHTRAHAQVRRHEQEDKNTQSQRWSRMAAIPTRMHTDKRTISHYWNQYIPMRKFSERRKSLDITFEQSKGYKRHTRDE